jgi:hypothetical protein
MDAFQPLINLLVLLSALSLAAERVTNVVKLRYESIRDKADFFEILGNLQAPWDTLGWAHMQAGELVRRSALTNLRQGLYALVGSVFTGLALGFGSKFWHDMLDIVFNSREWLTKGARA